jgi:hypothetical protein
MMRKITIRITWAKPSRFVPQVHPLVISDEFTESKIVIVENACVLYD